MPRRKRELFQEWEVSATVKDSHLYLVPLKKHLYLKTKPLTNYKILAKREENILWETKDGKTVKKYLWGKPFLHCPTLRPSCMIVFWLLSSTDIPEFIHTKISVYTVNDQCLRYALMSCEYVEKEVQFFFQIILHRFLVFTMKRPYCKPKKSTTKNLSARISCCIYL